MTNWGNIIADTWNEAKSIWIKNQTGNSLQSLSQRYDRDELENIGWIAYELLKERGISLNVSPGTQKGELSVDPLPEGSLLK